MNILRLSLFLLIVRNPFLAAAVSTRGMRSLSENDLVNGIKRGLTCILLKVEFKSAMGSTPYANCKVRVPLLLVIDEGGHVRSLAAAAGATLSIKS